MLDHMPNVEQAALFAYPPMGVSDRLRGVLYGHFVGSEGDHSGAMADVEVVEGRAFEAAGRRVGEGCHRR